MQLLTDELRAQLPAHYAQESNKDPTVYVKFFAPSGNWTWYVTEGEQTENDFVFFGYVIGHVGEWGYFSLNELLSVRVPPFGLPIERDLHFKPAPWSEVKKRERLEDVPERESDCGCLGPGAKGG
jgi:hypothetical protein